MAYAKLIAFDRRLSGVAIAGQAGRYYTEPELAARETQAYQRGVDATRGLADQQMVELRHDIAQLGDGVFKKLSTVEPTLLAQLRDALPGLALEIARRLLAGYEPPPEVISRLCEEALAEIFPERENLELVIAHELVDHMAHRAQGVGRTVHRQQHFIHGSSSRVRIPAAAPAAARSAWCWSPARRHLSGRVAVRACCALTSG